MGTLGQYLRSARQTKDIDIRDAAQQTRISINYLKALEDEDFSKLPGEVFVRGFLKNYARFLNLDEAETLRRYGELKPSPSPLESAAKPGTEKKTASPEGKSQSKEETPIEPFVWGAAIFISLLVFLFTSLPMKHLKKGYQSEKESLPIPSVLPQEASQSPSAKSDKLYLEVVALEDTWLLVRTDTSPQKKAVLKKGESLIWSADERFLLSYGRVSDLKLLLNGEELTVRGTGQTPIRDLAVTRAGIINQPLAAKQPQPARPKPKLAIQPLQPDPPAAEPQSVQPAAPASPPAPAAVPLPAAEPVQAPAQLPPQTQ